MAIAFDAAGPTDAWVNNETTLTFSHTCTGSDLILLVGVGMTGTDGPTGVTYDGVALTRVDKVAFNSNFSCSLWYKVGPATGAHNVVISKEWAGRIHAASVSYTSVSSGTPLGTAATATNDSSTPFTVNVSSATGEVVVDVCFSASTAALSIDVGTGQTKRVQSLDTTTIGNVLAMSDEAGAATVTMSWTQGASPQPWASIGVPLKPAASGQFARPAYYYAQL